MEKFFEADLHGEEEAEGGRVGDDQKAAQRRVLLARAAFTLMDEDSDGDLTLKRWSPRSGGTSACGGC